MSLIRDINYEADPTTINRYASVFLKSDKLPDKIHDLLQTLFTKRVAKFRQHIMMTEKGYHNEKHLLKQGFSAIVGNSLILLTLLESAQTKKLLNYYYDTINSTKTRNFTQFFKKLDNKSPAYFFCGISTEDINKVRASLMDASFDLFTQKLPLPIRDNSYILHLLAQDIPWQQYLKTYHEAEQYFYNKDMFRTKKILVTLNSITVIKLIPVELLLVKVNAEIKEAEEASDLIHDLLSEAVINKAI
ncbi:MAG: hypothetical protein ACJAXS_002136 [Colwellia sp.]|jgi:hypothetical protein